jgi:diguanylate cyclase (GGDEF)-like protein
MAFWGRIGLRGKSVFVVVAIYLLVAVVGGVIALKATHSALDYFSANFARKSALLHKERILLPILRELTLARKLADSAVIQEWMAHENDPEISRLALAELRSYRNFFHEHTYFAAPTATRNFYFDDAAGTYTGNEVRQVLDKNDPDDIWFFSSMDQPTPFNLNVDSNNALKTTKLWINVAVDRGNRRLGIVGTGMELDRFIKEFTTSSESGVSAVIFDQSGAIQAHQNPDVIDLNSFSKREGDKQSKVFSLVSDYADVERLRVAAAFLKEGRTEVEMLPISFEGRNRLAALAYMPEIGWYVMILIDVGRVFNLTQFLPQLTMLAVLLVAVVVIILFLLNRILLEPLISLTRSANAVALGDYNVTLSTDRTDEIGQLGRAFTDMAHKVQENTQMLESRVRERTEELASANCELQIMASTDALTGLTNRRAFLELGEAELKRASRSGRWPSVFLLDLDFFKRVNDSWGHAAGDEALRHVAGILLQELREVDVVARFGGEEFIALLPETALKEAVFVAERVRQAIAAAPVRYQGQSIAVTASIGAANGKIGDALDSIVGRADQALYRAKEQGRNRVCQAEDGEMVTA